jgi:hypothetical protein
MRYSHTSCHDVAVRCRSYDAILVVDAANAASRETMLAQALIEHGMLSTLAATIERTSVIVEDFVRGVDTRVAIGILVIALVVLFRRR